MMKFFVFNIYHAIFILLIKMKRKLEVAFIAVKRGHVKTQNMDLFCPKYVFHRSQWVYITPTNDCNTVY